MIPYSHHVNQMRYKGTQKTTADTALLSIILQLTGAKIGNRLMAEAETNLAINVLPGPLSESYEVQGRGELQLGLDC
jgi:hypothetical protein